jgi:hypothetical protein
MKVSSFIKTIAATAVISIIGSVSAQAEGTNDFFGKTRAKYAENKELIDGLAAGFKEANKIYKESREAKAARDQAERDWDYKMRMLDLEERKIRALEKLAKLRELGILD